MYGMKKAFSNKFLYTYIGIYVLYYLQGFLYASGSLISQAFLLLYLLMSLYGLYKFVKSTNKPDVIKLLAFFLLLNVLTFLVSDKTVYGRSFEAIGEVNVFGQFKNIVGFVSSIFIPYIYVRKNGISDKSLARMAILFIIMSFIRYSFAFNELQEESESTLGFTNNAGYIVVCTIPFVPFLLKEHKWVAIALVVTLIGLIMTASKRGAILCMLVSLVFSLVFYMKATKFSLKRIIVVAVIACAAGYAIYDNYSTNEYLQYRLEKTEEQGAGAREIAYAILWEHWLYDSNIVTQVIGNGSAQTIEVWGNYAHNDWLELLIDNGLVGVVLYLLIFIYGFRYIYKSELEPITRLSAYLCMIIWLLKTNFSMGYTDIVNAIFVICLAICIGKHEHDRIKEGKMEYGN